jgi:NADPH:quinone reductase
MTSATSRRPSCRRSRTLLGWLDLVGGAYLSEDIDACSIRGRVLVVGLTAGPRAELNFGDLLRKRITLIGTSLRARPLEEKIQAAQLLEKNLGPWLAARVMRPVVDRLFALEEAPAAHSHVGGNQSFGKVLLRVGGAG